MSVTYLHSQVFKKTNVPSVIVVVMHGAYAINVVMIMSGFVIANCWQIRTNLTGSS